MNTHTHTYTISVFITDMNREIFSVALMAIKAFFICLDSSKVKVEWCQVHTHYTPGKVTALPCPPLPLSGSAVMRFLYSLLLLLLFVGCSSIRMLFRHQLGMPMRVCVHALMRNSDCARMASFIFTQKKESKGKEKSIGKQKENSKEKHAKKGAKPERDGEQREGKQTRQLYIIFHLCMCSPPTQSVCVCVCSVSVCVRVKSEMNEWMACVTLENLL